MVDHRIEIYLNKDYASLYFIDGIEQTISALEDSLQRGKIW